MNSRRLILLAALSVAALFTATAGASNGWVRHTAGLSRAQRNGAGRTETVRFVALGDTGTGGKGQFDVARQMVGYHDQKHYDTVLLLGDNVYPHGDASELPLKFEQPYAELLRRGVRFHAVLGNHDVDSGREAQINYPPFNMGGQPYYSFVESGGLVEFFALDSNRMDAGQVRWLEGALSASKARWKIAFFHHPIYSSGGKHGSNQRLRALLEPLFVRHGVAAAFSGHDHIYERIKPQQGVQYFVSGAGGQLRRGDLDRGAPFFAAGNDQVNSFMYVEVTPERMDFWSVGAEGQILDAGALTPRPQVSGQSGVKVSRRWRDEGGRPAAPPASFTTAHSMHSIDLVPEGRRVR